MSYAIWVCLHIVVSNTNCDVFFFCLSSSCVLCMVMFNTYCVMFFVFLVFVLCFVYGGVQHILRCVFCFVCLRLVYPMLPVSLDCPFLISPSVSPTLIENK
jgi:hypothetical protein